MKTRSSLHRTASQGLLVGILALGTILPAVAQQTAANPSSGWQYTANLYLWAPAVTSTTTAGDEMEASFSDILSNLDLSLMGGVQARHGRLSLSADLLYMGLSQDVETTANLVGHSREVEADMEMKSVVPSLAVGYTVVETERLQLDVLAGVRYLWVDVDLDFGLTGPLGLDRKRSESADIIDGIVGVRGNLALGEQWFMPFYLDVGAGESDLTWQAFVGVGYRLCGNIDVIVGYRHLAWEFDGAGILDELEISGPIAGVKVGF